MNKMTQDMMTIRYGNSKRVARRLFSCATTCRFFILVLLMTVLGVNNVWGATITYHIINLGRLDNSGQLTETRTEALKFTVTADNVTVGVPDKYKSPLAKNWQYYSSGDVTFDNDTKVCVFNSGPSLSVGNALSDGAHVYVTYELDKDKFREVGIYNRGIYKIKFPDNYYLKQTTWYNSTTEQTEVNTGSAEDPTTYEFLWKFNIIDPYQITVQSQSGSYLNWYLCSKLNSNGVGNFGDIRLNATISGALATDVWVFGLLNGGTSDTYRLVVTDGYTMTPDNSNQLDSFGHGYLNNKRNGHKTTYQLYNKDKYDECNLTFEPVTRNYIIVNNSGDPLVQALTDANTLEVPDVIKSPLASYTYYGTQQDAIDEGTQLTSATGATIYVRYTTNDALDLSGVVKYNVAVGGSNYLYAADATTLSSEATSSNNGIDTHKWTLTGNDAYQITIKNVGNSKEIAYDVFSGEAVPTLSVTGSKFFFHQSTEGKYEVVAITSNDYSTPDYYTLGMDAGNLKLYSSSSHAFGADEVQSIFTPRPVAAITTAPTANSLTYNGSNQELVTAGIASNGTMKYRIGDTGSYETSIPEAKDANTYSVYYMAAGADGYDDFVALEPIEVTINKQSVTVTSGITASDKTYDGTTNATLNSTGAVFTGKIGNDDITIVSATGTFDNKHVGTNKHVDITGLTFGGAAAANYTLSESGNQASITANITAKEITVSGITAENKVYNGNTAATLVYTNGSLTGKVDGDDLSISATGTFADANIGAGKTVTISELALEGADLGNYVLAVSGQQETTTADINAKAVTITANDAKKTYDGSALTQPDFTATALEDGDTHTFTVTMTEGSTITDVGTQPNVIATVDGVAVTTGIETVVGNYLVTTVNGTLTINASITIILDDWTYGSPKNPSVTGNTGDGTVTYSYKKRTEADSKYTTNKPVNVGDYTVRAEVAATETTAAATATKDFSITAAPLTIKADAKAKEYFDDDPQLTYTVTGLKNNDIAVNVITCVLQRASGENVGSYDITEDTSQRNLKSNNYTFSSFTKAKLTINKKNLGDGNTPAPGIGIYAKKTGETTWDVSVYNGKNALRYDDTDLSKTDYTYVVAGNSITITAQGNNCTGSAKATYSSDATFYAINGTNEKYTPYISTTSDLTTSADLVPFIVSQINPSIGTISVVPISYIPKDEPVLLLAPSDVTGITTSPKNSEIPVLSESLISNNKLHIASEGGVRVHATEAYMFYKGEFVLTTEGIIKKGNFYLYNPNYHPDSSTGPSPVPMRYLSIVKGEATSIIQLMDGETKGGFNDVWYTIDGQKLNKKPTRKGFYIHNGKKKIVK